MKTSATASQVVKMFLRQNNKDITETWNEDKAAAVKYDPIK
jgi:hypothetical protein